MLVQLQINFFKLSNFEGGVGRWWRRRVRFKSWKTRWRHSKVFLMVITGIDFLAVQNLQRDIIFIHFKNVRTLKKIKMIQNLTLGQCEKSKIRQITWPGLAIQQKTRRFGKYLCMKLWKKTPSYLPRPRVEYLYFERLWWLLVELNRAKLFLFSTIYGSCSNNYSTLMPYVQICIAWL